MCHQLVSGALDTNTVTVTIYLLLIAKFKHVLGSYLWLITNYNVIIHGKRDIIDGKLKGRAFVDSLKSTSSPGWCTARNHFTDNFNRVLETTKLMLKNFHLLLKLHITK